MTGRNAPRSKNGCSTCRRRKVKCGEERPVCKRCSALGITCEWAAVVKRGRSHTPVPIQPARARRPTTTAAATSSTAEQPPLDFNSLALSPQFSQMLCPEALFPEIWTFLPAAFTAPTPLYPSLSGTDIACSNSLMLMEQDQIYFQYFPSSSVVFYYIKSWAWSGFSYLYQGPAASSKVVMRMILALAANDMHRNGLLVRSPGRPSAEDHARYHYGLAVKEFRQLLETREKPLSQPELEIVFASMFLMISYEWQFGQSVQDLQLHLRGVRSLLESHSKLFEGKEVDEVLMFMDTVQSEAAPQVSFIPEQLLLWIIYIDSGCRSMGTADSLTEYVLQSGNQAIHPDRLYRCARLWGRCFWGKQYPDQEVSDDMENYRALELLHAGMTLRYKIWQALSDDAVQTNNQAELLLKEIKATREVWFFQTVLDFAGPASTRRTLNTINMAVSTFYAQVLFHRRLLYPPGPPSPFQRVAVTNIIEIARKQYASDPRLLRRIHWPLLMAIIETDDISQREWLRERLVDLRGFHSEYAWASDLADEILALQDTSKDRYADIASFFRRHVTG
ncbi:uncharacterized protein ANIA_10083 [Aspergillus nidulans FGSC A4]|uniref:Zn(II)2Cys6 transcription factor (Eurofung) n=1 Tax=Emericella nidulans (strain FGSC A4 / ATCC 38163 / CBS 112.46 / NRRL 194 / M139) TaxID=227321 RepID=C8VSY1_EMENI|nr:hypothetical protein [Aspergillus nidulans FGSC A4]CBF89366.1 TPA: Putative Zn(II)2Cys6 transcription factor (Eurofung) [Aspergillus nidulans FGSC A4]